MTRLSLSVCATPKQCVSFEIQRALSFRLPERHRNPWIDHHYRQYEALETPITTAQELREIPRRVAHRFRYCSHLLAMIRFINRSLAIRSHVWKLSQELLRRFGKKHYYSIAEVSDAARRASVRTA